MNKNQEESLEELRKAKEEYLSTEGITNMPKEGQAKENFDKLADASDKCWKEVHSNTSSPAERQEFKEKFKKEIQK